MSAELINNAGDTLTVKIGGKLAQSELNAVQKSAAEIMEKEGKKHLLVVAEGFEGWGTGDWDDLSGQIAMDPYIDRMAIVGDERWKDLALMFAGQGIRHIAIEYFSTAELADAGEWLAAKNDDS